MSRHHMSLSVKLASGFALILFIFSCAAIFNHSQMGQINEKDQVKRAQSERLQLAADLKQIVLHLDSTATGFMLSGDNRLLQQFNELSTELNPLVNQVKETAQTRDQREWGARLTAVAKEFIANFERVKSISEQEYLTALEKQRAYSTAYSASQLHKQTIFTLVQQFYDDYLKASKQAEEEMTELVSSTKVFTTSAAAAALVIGILLAYIIVYSLKKGIRGIQHSVDMISEGDLRYSISAKRKDELGLLSDSLDASVSRMKNMLLNTRSVAETLREQSGRFVHFAHNTAEANSNIVIAMEQMAAGSSKQAVEAERSASVLYDWEERLGTIASTADGLLETSKKANVQMRTGTSLIEELRSASMMTANALQSMQQALSCLDEQSGEIAGITEIIAGVAQRTNILALNASIESARAGEHGKGFAVIAQEVRELSARTAQSSKRINDILTELRQQINDVLQLMSSAMDRLLLQNGKVGETLAEFQSVFTLITAFDAQIRFIHDKVQETKAKQGELTNSVQIVASIAQQTAAGVQEAAASAAEQNRTVGLVEDEAQDMNKLSETIFDEINKFKIEG